MNILFIGGAGFIGSSLVKQFLTNEKYKVFVIEPEFANVSRLNGCDVTIFREALGNIDKVENKKGYDKAIKGKEPLKKGFGNNLLSLVVGEIDYSTDIKKFKPKMNHALYHVTPQDLTPTQQEEWKNIGQLMFSWTCCLKPRY